MKGKSLLLVSGLAFFGLSMASAKSYDIAVDTATKAGSAQLAAGSYTLTVKGDNAVFTDGNGNQTTTPVKIEYDAKKHEVTAVDSTKANGGEKIRKIELGGSTETLEFGE